MERTTQTLATNCEVLATRKTAEEIGLSERNWAHLHHWTVHIT